MIHQSERITQKMSDEEHDIDRDHTHKEEKVELKRTPCSFQRSADPVITEKRKRCHKRIAETRDEDKCDEPPNLSLQDLRRIHIQEENGCRSHQTDHIDDGTSEDHIPHQVGDRSFADLAFQSVKPIITLHSIYPFWHK